MSPWPLLFCHLKHGLGLRQYPSTFFLTRNEWDVVRDQGYESFDNHWALQKWRNMEKPTWDETSGLTSWTRVVRCAPRDLDDLARWMSYDPSVTWLFRWGWTGHLATHWKLCVQLKSQDILWEFSRTIKLSKIIGKVYWMLWDHRFLYHIREGNRQAA